MEFCKSKYFKAGTIKPYKFIYILTQCLILYKIDFKRADLGILKKNQYQIDNITIFLCIDLDNSIESNREKISDCRELNAE